MIPQFNPYIGEDEANAAAKVIRSGWITAGEQVKEFERQIAELCNVQYAVACSNGTMALFMALKAIGIKEGDEVIVPDFTFIASANAVTLTGATPVFCDIDHYTWQIDVQNAWSKITDKTKAIMPVHLFGQSADIKALCNFCQGNIIQNIRLIEDAAQGVGVQWLGHPVGGLGDAGCLSFYADKTITTGEGGMVLTNSEPIAKFCRMFAQQGRTNTGVYIHDNIGYNFRMTDIQAAIGLEQLKKLDFIIQRKREMKALYRAELDDKISFPAIDARSNDVPFRVVIIVPDPVDLQSKLTDIQVRPVFYPLHLQPPYKQEGKFPHSIYAHAHGLALPSWVGLTDEQIKYISKEVNRCAFQS